MPTNGPSKCQRDGMARAGAWLAAAAIAGWLFGWPLWARHAAPADRSLRFSYWGGPEDHRMWGEVIAAFERRHPGTAVSPEWLPLSGYSIKLSQQFIGRSAPDVVLFQDEPLPRYAAEFLDLSGRVERDAEARAALSDLHPGAYDSFEIDGALRGLPIMGGVTLIYCNLAAFERAAAFHGRPIAPPASDWTLDDFVETCRALTLDVDGDGRIDQYGLFQPGWVYFLPLMWSCGASLTDESGRCWTLSGPPAVEAFSLYANLRHRWAVTPTPSDYAGQNSDTAFLSGRVAMCVNGPWFQSFLADTALAGRYRVVSIPRGPGGSAPRATWDALCLYRGIDGARREHAWEFARFALSDAAQEILARYQRAVPARRSMAASYLAHGGGPGSPAETFLREQARSRLQRATPHWMELSRCVSRHLTSVLLDGPSRRSPADAVAALATEPAVVRHFGGDKLREAAP